MRENAGFEIIANCPLAAEGEEIVMGRRIERSELDTSPYVTWFCRNGDRYSMGHYIADADSAREDFASRIIRGY